MSIKAWFKEAVFLQDIEEGKSIRRAMVIGFLLRIVPVMVWPTCVRDECTHLRLSERILNGEGQRLQRLDLAPGYPFILHCTKV